MMRTNLVQIILKILYRIDFIISGFLDFIISSSHYSIIDITNNDSYI